MDYSRVSGEFSGCKDNERPYTADRPVALATDADIQHRCDVEGPGKPKNPLLHAYVTETRENKGLKGLKRRKSEGRLNRELIAFSYQMTHRLIRTKANCELGLYAWCGPFNVLPSSQGFACLHQT